MVTDRTDRPGPDPELRLRPPGPGGGQLASVAEIAGHAAPVRRYWIG